jgi:DivIVA domain-containing protein
MAGDHRIVISSEPSLAPEEVATRSFATSFRGYDPNEVRNWLARVGKELRTLRDRERELQRLLERAQDESSRMPLDEAALTTALGEETARVLRSAREAATDITMKAEEKAGRVLRETQEQANRVRTETEQFTAQRMEEANQAAAALLRAAEADAEALRAQAKADAEAEVESARAKGKEMIAEAMAVRERVLADLSRRRRAGHAQLEQLRVGRERLLEAYRLVRRTLDEVTAELTVAEAEAKAAAEAAARRVAAEAAAEDLEAELSLARAVELPVVEPPPPEPQPQPEPQPEPSEPEPPAAPAVPVITTTPTVERPSPLPPPASEETPGNGTNGTGERRRSSSLRLLRRSKAEGGEGADVPPGFVPVAQPHPDEAVRVVGTAPPAEAEAEAVPAPEPDAVPSTVAELFARIRAAREEAEDAIEDAAGAVEAPAGDEAEEAKDADEAEEALGPVPGVAAEADDGEDETVRCRRDELLDPIEATLVRKLKRVLQDEQNEVLDALRTQKGTPAVAALLPDAPDHRRRYEAAAAFALADAFRAGIGFAAGEGARPDVEPVVTEHLSALAAGIVDDLRERVEAALAGLADVGGDQSVAVEPISAAYRQTKTQRADRVARDAVSAAFGAGAYAAFPKGAVLRWVVDTDGMTCPDAHDNALAGATVKGSPYPTGQPHPPAHAGCRCLLVPSRQ